MTAACPYITTDLTNEEAFAIVEPYFDTIRDDYVAAGLVLCKRTRLVIDPDMHDTARHFAACQDDGLVILLAPEIAEMPDGSLMAIIAHELGHACDFLYPGQFAMQGDDEPAALRDPSSMKPKHWHKWLKDWESRDDDLVEMTADAIAHRVMGVRYGYQGPCLIQSLEATRVRPKGLR